MELPIARESYQPSSGTLLRALRRAEAVLARMLSDEADLDGATAYTSATRPGLRFANFAADVTPFPPRGEAGSGGARERPDAAPPSETPGRSGDELAMASRAAPLPASPHGGGEELLDRIDTHFAERGVRCLALHGGDMPFPEEFTAAASARGYRPRKRHLYLLKQLRRPQRLNDQLQIIPARAVYPHLRAFFLRAALAHGAPADMAEQVAQAGIDHLDEPRLEMFLGRLDGEAVGVVGTVSLGNIGVVHDLFVLPEHNGKGVVRTLMDHLIDHCQRALFEQVIIDVPDACPAIPTYESFGFAPVAGFVNLVR